MQQTFKDKCVSCVVANECLENSSNLSRCTYLEARNIASFCTNILTRCSKLHSQMMQSSISPLVSIRIREVMQLSLYSRMAGLFNFIVFCLFEANKNFSAKVCLFEEKFPSFYFPSSSSQSHIVCSWEKRLNFQLTA